MSTAAQISGLLADYASPEQTAVELGVSTRTLARWYAMRIGPPRVTIGRKPLYRRESVSAWIEKQEKDPAAVTTTKRRRA